MLARALALTFTSAIIQARVIKKPNNCLAWISGNFKTVWKGESAKLKNCLLVFKICSSVELPDLFFCVADSFLFTKSEG